LLVASGDRAVARIDRATDERVTRMPRIDVQVQMGDRVAVEFVVDPHRPQQLGHGADGGHRLGEEPLLLPVGSW
jgi:hypothetical protein